MSKLLKPLFLLAALALSAAVATAQSIQSAPASPASTATQTSPDAQTPADAKPLHYEDTTSVEAKAPPVPPPSDTVTKLETNVLDLPLSLSVVSNRLAAEQAGFVLGDALKNASGVNVATGCLRTTCTALPRAPPPHAKAPGPFSTSTCCTL